MVVKLGHPPGTRPRYRDEGPTEHLRHACATFEAPVRRAALNALRERLPLIPADPAYITTAELGDLL